MVVSGKMMDYEDEFLPDFHNEIAVRQLNERLPEDIRVFSCMFPSLDFTLDTRVSNNFNPHLNSFSRQYLYFLPVDLYKRTLFHTVDYLSNW